MKNSIVVYDLCDSSGKLLNINDPSSFAQITQSIEGGAQYVLVSIEGKWPRETSKNLFTYTCSFCTGDRPCDVKPLLENYEAKFPNLTGEDHSIMLVLSLFSMRM